MDREKGSASRYVLEEEEEEREGNGSSRLNDHVTVGLEVVLGTNRLPYSVADSETRPAMPFCQSSRRGENASLRTNSDSKTWGGSIL